MKTILNVCLIFALNLMFIGYGFSQAAATATQDVTPPVSNQEIPEQYLYSRDSSVPKDVTTDPQAHSFHGLVLPTAIERKINTKDFDGAWEDFENFKKEVSSAQQAQLLEIEIYLCERSSSLDGANKEVWLKKLAELRKTILSKYPKWSGSYTSQFDPSFPPEKIVEFASTALKYDPKDEFALEQRGKSYIRMNKISEGCADLEHLPNKDEFWEYNNFCKK